MTPLSISATAAKNAFGQVLHCVTSGGVVVITSHDTPTAVVLSFDAYEALQAQSARTLNTLSEEFDGLLARMQTPRAKAGMKAAFDASPAELGKSALAAARKRG